MRIECRADVIEVSARMSKRRLRSVKLGEDSVSGKRTRLVLLGRLRLEDDAGRRVEIRGGKTQALLAYLALPAGRRHHRDHLATLCGVRWVRSVPVTISANAFRYCARPWAGLLWPRTIRLLSTRR